MKPRMRPYTKKGIGRVPCSRCGQPSVHQWNICADGNQFRGCCVECDIALNETVLAFMRIPDANAKLRAYRARATATSRQSKAARPRKPC